MAGCRVAVGIPSYCEADSIAHVTAQVDAGLSREFGAKSCTIVNMDGASPDGTSAVFRGVPTRCRKESVIVSDQPGGKGQNVLRFLRLCASRNVGALAIIDADVTSISPAWVDALLGPVVAGTVDYVAPLYRRSRFEGATTAHFAYPFFLATTGNDVRQPIGGDFGLSVELARYLLQRPVEEGVEGYGIDVFMSLHAMRGRFRLAQAELGYKRHKPSFPRRARIFGDVVTTALSITRSWELAPELKVRQDLPCGIAEAGEFSHAQATRALLGAARVTALTLMPAYRAWLGRRAAGLCASLGHARPRLAAEQWTDVLAAAVAVYRAGHGDSSACSARTVADLLDPLHSIRSVTLWDDSLRWSSSQVEQDILRQARLLRRKLVAHRCVRGGPLSRHRLPPAPR